MGTRGAFGFRVDGVDKVTYNHWDSYPSGMGAQILEDIRAAMPRGLEQLKEQARHIVLVNEGDDPTPAQMVEGLPYLDLDVSSQSAEDWYCLLREAQGTLRPWLFDGLPFMIDSHTFLGDSLFCEYAYIVNLDDGTLECYRGFNTKEGQPGRYADTGEPQFSRGYSIQMQDGSKVERPDVYYRGVVLMKTYPLDALPSEDDFVEELEAIDEAAED